VVITEIINRQIDYLSNSTLREPPFEDLRIERQDLRTGSNDRFKFKR
jgi:hypothetical protein